MEKNEINIYLEKRQFGIDSNLTFYTDNSIKITVDNNSLYKERYHYFKTILYSMKINKAISSIQYKTIKGMINSDMVAVLRFIEKRVEKTTYDNILYTYKEMKMKYNEVRPSKIVEVNFDKPVDSVKLNVIFN